MVLLSSNPVLEAKIMVVEAKGGLASSGTSFKNNTILLKHKGGDSLDIKNTKVIITGTGQSHRGLAVPMYHLEVRI